MNKDNTLLSADIERKMLEGKNIDDSLDVDDFVFECYTLDDFPEFNENNS